MNSKHSPKKILVNGCSHTAAEIPDLLREDWKRFCWPKLLSNKLKCEVVNLAVSGKANFQIIEETLRYLLNYSDVDHVVVQLTDWPRINLFKKSKSFTMIPGEVSSQFGKEQSSLYIMASFPNSILEDNGRVTEYGDKSKVYEILNTFTLLNSLYLYCTQKNIKLSLLNYHPINPDILNDIVVKNIPKEIFIQSDITIGMHQYLDTKYRRDGGHFHKPAHVELSERIADHLENGNQIVIRKELIMGQEKIIYDYTS